MNRILLEVLVVLAFGVFVMLFLFPYEFVSILIPSTLPETIWNYRVVESLSQAVLILAVVIGVFALMER
jgi:hypothetical protein